jgi:hypothetical protein
MLLNTHQNIRHVLINEAVVRREKSALYYLRGEGAQFWTSWADEEALVNGAGDSKKS